MSIKNDYHKALNANSRKLHIVYKSILVGLCVGIVTTLYRLALTKAEELSIFIYSYIEQHSILIIPMFVLLGILGWLIGVLINKFPMVSGSGIPQVKGQLIGYFNNHWISTLFAKFIGGTVSILAGLSVGREGPSIQLGAATANGLGLRLASNRTERKILIAGGASAGLAAAFNAPLAGVMFSIEEIFRYFSPIILLSTITASIAADFISKLVFGMEPVFHFEMNNSIPLKYYWLIIILGGIVGIFGAFYNYVLLKTLALYKTLNRYFKVIIPFLLAGVFGLAFPMVLGGGHHIIEALSLSQSIKWLFFVLLFKFVFSMISFGSGAPGGIFFPFLVIGSLIGGIFGNAAITALGINPDLFYNFVALAMAGYFAAIVRAPITGIILLTEMTGSFSHLLSLTVVSVIAYVTADLLKSVPVYESLLELQMRSKGFEHSDEDEFRKLMIEVIVHFGSRIENNCLKDLSLPSGSLVIAIRRNGKDITPRGDTRIRAEDNLIVLTSKKDEPVVREVLQKMTESS